MAGAGAMFGSVLESEAIKTVSKLKEIAGRLRTGLVDASVLASIEEDLDIIEKAMICYESDAQKASEKIHEYYNRLLDVNPHYTNDIDILKDCITRLKRYV